MCPSLGRLHEDELDALPVLYNLKLTRCEENWPVISYFTDHARKGRTGYMEEIIEAAEGETDGQGSEDDR